MNKKVKSCLFTFIVHWIYNYVYTLPHPENEQMAPNKEPFINRNIIPTVKFQEIC